MTHDGGPDVRRSAHSTVGGLFLEHARRAPETIALEDGRNRWNYGQLDRRTAQLAGMLVGLGVGEGDRVANKSPIIRMLNQYWVIA